MKVCLIIISIHEKLDDSDEIIKYEIIQWGLFVIHILMSSWMILFYVYKHLSSYNVYLETVLFNIQAVLNFQNPW